MDPAKKAAKLADSAYVTFGCHHTSGTRTGGLSQKLFCRRQPVIAGIGYANSHADLQESSGGRETYPGGSASHDGNIGG
jgi:hypothetical protein